MTHHRAIGAASQPRGERASRLRPAFRRARVAGPGATRAWRCRARARRAARCACGGRGGAPAARSPHRSVRPCAAGDGDGVGAAGPAARASGARSGGAPDGQDAVRGRSADAAVARHSADPARVLGTARRTQCVGAAAGRRGPPRRRRGVGEPTRTRRARLRRRAEARLGAAWGMLRPGPVRASRRPLRAGQDATD